MKKLGIAIILGVLMASPTYAQLIAGRVVSKAAVSPVKRFFASTSGSLAVLNYQTKQTSSLGVSANEQLSAVTTVNAIQANEDSEAVVVSRPLNYPNPFKINSGTTLYYELSKNMDVEIAIFDMMANQVYRSVRNAGAEGGLSGRNKVSLSMMGLESGSLTSGAYFYVIMHQGKVLAKGKMAAVI